MLPEGIERHMSSMHSGVLYAQVMITMQERLQQHPHSQGLRRVLAAVLSSYIKQASEAGRLCGHMYRCVFSYYHICNCLGKYR